MLAIPKLIENIKNNSKESKVSSEIVKIPSVYSNIKRDNHGNLIAQITHKNSHKQYPLRKYHSKWTIDKLRGNPKGDLSGIRFDFKNTSLNGTLYYGFIEYKHTKYPQMIFFKRSEKVKNGKVFVNIVKNLSGKYDLIDWKKNKMGDLGYRVINHKGSILFDGQISFLIKDNQFMVNPMSIVEGPFVHQITHQSAIISFDTLKDSRGVIRIGHRDFTDGIMSSHHEIKISGLIPSKRYNYRVICGNIQRTYFLKTAPKPGSRSPFIFAYASDSRTGQGGGERDIYGTNAYIMKKIMAIVTAKKSTFLLFTGDMINGYLPSPQETLLQYRNWKQVIMPFAHYLPVYVGMGNHESIPYIFEDHSNHGIPIDRFPFETDSTEAIFAQAFVNPTNGPQSEDGSKYDPNPNQMDFPTYKENVYSFTYDNIAVIVLNSNYWYSRTLTQSGKDIGGNLHGYLMDNQIDWLKHQLEKYDQDKNIDYIFVTQHTPIFPNGGHVKDDMWYDGNNSYRPYIAGKPVDYGILQQRDRYLKLLLGSQKVIAVFTGDEHNYNRINVTDMTTDMIYPKGYPAKYKLLKNNDFKRKLILCQINNGAAGAPYYAREKTPWSSLLKTFSTQNAVVFLHIHGKNIRLEVINPDTLEVLELIQNLDSRGQ